MASEPLNPVDVEDGIRALALEIGKSVRVVTDTLAAFREAERIYEREFAREFLAYQGPANAKKYAAELHTTDLRAARDTAEVAWRYAERTAASLERQLSAYQSINRSVVGMYSAAGAMGTGGG